jgi:hypothetical protein
LKRKACRAAGSYAFLQLDSTQGHSWTPICLAELVSYPVRHIQRTSSRLRVQARHSRYSNRTSERLKQVDLLRGTERERGAQSFLQLFRRILGCPSALPR